MLLTYLHSLRGWYWRIFKPVTLGTRMIVVKDHRVLLIRMSYVRGWHLPGGGVDRGESFERSAFRETSEECGVEVQSAKLLGLYLNKGHGNTNHVAVYVANQFTEKTPARLSSEIAEVKWFALDDLPADLATGHRRRIEEFLGKAAPNSQW